MNGTLVRSLIVAAILLSPAVVLAPAVADAVAALSVPSRPVGEAAAVQAEWEERIRQAQAGLNDASGIEFGQAFFQ
jgi:hypothetical protein